MFFFILRKLETKPNMKNENNNNNKKLNKNK